MADPGAKRTGLGPVPAHAHITPLAALVFCAVEKQPAAMVSLALLDAGEIGIDKKVQRRKRDWSQNSCSQFSLGMPGPPIIVLHAE